MKYLEDFTPGQVFEFKAPGLSKAQIMEFASEWDPQRLHLDEDYAQEVHGGIIASGFQTMLLIFKPIMRELMADVENIGGLGFDSLRWLRPLYPEQPLDIRIELTTVKRSRSKPDRGVLAYRLEARNPDGKVIFTTDTGAMIKCRTEGQT